MPTASQGRLYGAANAFTNLLLVDKTGDGTTNQYNRATGVGMDVVRPRLIYGIRPQETDACWTSYFGYVDPMVQPPATPIPTTAPPVVAWAWPTMLRVRITLCDAVDPTPASEQTYEFLFELPKR